MFAFICTFAKCFKTENQMMCFPVAAKAEATAHSK